MPSRCRRSVFLAIGALHELTQASSPSTEVDMHRRHTYVERFGNFLGRAVRVVVHHYRDPLVGRELLERGHEMGGRGRQLIGRLPRPQGIRLSPSELPCSDPEGGCPYPRLGRTNLITAGDRLCERFGQRVRGDLSITAVGEERPPEVRPNLPIQSLHRLDTAQHTRVPHICYGATSHQNLYLSSQWMEDPGECMCPRRGVASLG